MFTGTISVQFVTSGQIILIMMIRTRPTFNNRDYDYDNYLA